MKGLKLYEAVNEIDDDLIEEAMVKPAIKIRRKYAAVAAAAALALTIGSLEIVGIINMSKFSELSAGGYDEEMTSEENIYVPITSVPNFEASTESKTQTYVTEQTCVPFDSIPENNNFSGLPLEYWLESDRVIWGNDTVKGSIGSEKLPPRTVKISPELGRIMKDENDDTVYAVLVDFEPCINKKEMENWEYNGDTIAVLTAEKNKLYTDNGEYSDSDGEHTEPPYGISDKELFNELTERIASVRSAYYNMKLQEFESTFRIKNGMEIYTDPWAEKVLCFYTFAVRSQLESFVCGESEAFVFFPAQRFK